jgi:hypothetical protein
MSVAPRAAEVLADLGVAVGHQATSDPVFLKHEAEESSAHWLAGAKPSKLSREVLVEQLCNALDGRRQAISPVVSVSHKDDH